MITDQHGRSYPSVREWWAEVDRKAGCKGCEGHHRPHPKPETTNTWSDERSAEPSTSVETLAGESLRRPPSTAPAVGSS